MVVLGGGAKKNLILFLFVSEWPIVFLISALKNVHNPLNVIFFVGATGAPKKKKKQEKTRHLKLKIKKNWEGKKKKKGGGGWGGAYPKIEKIRKLPGKKSSLEGVCAPKYLGKI